ncbi:MAG: HAD-IIIC family phosphatase [Magnetospirillum sp.]|nr:MAG: HAD-IIIC family phosphatase [Magnetospirillum sp.]
MTWKLEHLPWLPEAPDDFRQRCKALRTGTGDATGELQALAGYRLNGNQMEALAKVMDACAGRVRFPASFRLGVLSNATVDLIIPLLKVAAARYGVRLEAEAAPFNQVAQTVYTPDSPFMAKKWDAMLLAIDRHGLPLAGGAEGALAYLNDLAEALRSRAGLSVILQTVPRNPLPLFGSLDLRQSGTERATIDAFNRGLAEMLAGGADLLLDTAALAETVGLTTWHNPRQWHMARLPFSQALAPLYADHVARLIAALRGRSRKCLVMDLDNTLWGGVIGDDGVAGIRLGQGDPVGEAFLAVQETALRLRDRGVVLAVCSKNTDSIAREPFRSHPAMALKEDHIAAFVANWIDKAANLTAIAEALEIGLDSLVFLDDNPAERAQVREALPQVAVPELPDDPALYPLALLSGGYFEAVAFSADDIKRAEQYQANSQRKELHARAGNLDAFLRSLKMQFSARPFDTAGRSRISQLINRSNQFNLTTRRYTEAEVAAMEADPELSTLQVSLTDCFGDNGMISVVICRKTGADWEIDTWLMSCRVLKRRVEEAVLSRLVEAARAAGARRLIGRFIPSGRNDLVRDHFADLGFRQSETDGLDSLWILDMDAWTEITDLPFTIID